MDRIENLCNVVLLGRVLELAAGDLRDVIPLVDVVPEGFEVDTTGLAAFPSRLAH